MRQKKEGEQGAQHRRKLEGLIVVSLLVLFDREGLIGPYGFPTNIHDKPFLQVTRTCTTSMVGHNATSPTFDRLLQCQYTMMDCFIEANSLYSCRGH